MDARNCPRCGKVFRPVGGRRICLDCVEADREEFQTVRDYLRKHPSANMLAVSEATGVTVKKLQEYIREGRLNVTGLSDWGIPCEKCGEPVSSGRYCPKCAEEFKRGLQRKPGAWMGERSPKKSIQKVHRDKFRRWR